jgi:hypothetical protein
MNQENQQPEELFMSFQEKDAIFRYKRSQHMDVDKFVELYFRYKNRPTPEELSESYIADFKKGILVNRNSGKEIINIHNGYKRATFKGKCHYVHVLLYTMYHKRWPKINMLVDHRDTNSLNNSISNLYEVTIKQNNNNTKKKENHKYGISIKTLKDGSKKYVVKRSRKYLGTFKTHEEAMLVSLAYDKQLEEEGIKPVPSQIQ